MSRLTWSVIVLSAALALALFAIRPAWLPLAEKTFALIGSVWIVLPFFRDNRLREIWSLLTEAPPGEGGFEQVRELLRKRMEEELRSFNPQDRSDARAGLMFLIMSFAIGVLHEIFKLAADAETSLH